MKTLFDTLKISYSEYCYYEELKPLEKINYLFELFDVAVTNSSDKDLASKLNDFFNSLQQEMDNDLNQPDEDLQQFSDDLDSAERAEYSDDIEMVDVMIDDKHLMIETNSLKALRYTIYKFFEIGYIISRDIETEKMFRPTKVTKYIRIFKIIDQSLSICLN